MGTLRILKSGFLVTIQDQGRKQCQHLGLAEAGALDKHAYYWSNYLLGNPASAPSLEILAGGCSFSFNASTIISLAGAEMEAAINKQPVANWSSSRVAAGDVLELGIIQNGLRAYLSIDGGFKAPHFFSSCSTVIREKTGGINGDRLKQGDTVYYPDEPVQGRTTLNKKILTTFIPDYDAELTLRFFPGYHFHEFDQSSIKKCLTSSYRVTNHNDRMGYRLSGPPLTRPKGDILSIGVPCGAIQIPPAGEPIILLNDRQCTGGYPILGTVSLRDIYRLGQRKTGDIIRFAIAEVEELKKEAMEFHQFFKFPITNYN